MVFIKARAVVSGKVQRIPEHYLDDPILGERFEELPPTPEFPEGLPDRSWKMDQLRAFADHNNVDLEGATRKDDVLAAIEARAGHNDSVEDTQLAVNEDEGALDGNA